ncbi:Tartrate-resistant acid phosphatase type 5 [Holothuria leucospilota]|uniref:Tartrate-resistant acid phosphatase type 5 n=1 Tax=Holothuria leucospilota TaxID=206669 RepID=A0A9Q1C7U0_HOLLE|nr:Tartrate-resistant acid phosphatase type 5 [Holothuria leucospilota]
MRLGLRILFFLVLTTCHVTKACSPYFYEDEEKSEPQPKPTTSPPVTHLPPRWGEQQDADSLNFVMIGDIGGIEDPPYTTRDQLRTADALATIASSFRLDFIAELGDNFYHNGVSDVLDPRFQDTFETVYDAESLTDVPWYITAGNHDWDGNVHAQVEYSRVSERWNYPSLYYSKRFAIPGIEGASLLLIMIDTMIICGNIDHNEHGTPPLGPAEKRQSLKQLGWLESELASASSETYVIVAGHYPVWSIGSHGPTDCLVEQVKTLLEAYNVTAFFGAHDHCLQHIHEDNSRVEYFVSGGGHLLDPSNSFIDAVPENWQKFHFGEIRNQGGFAYVTATASNMTVTFTDAVELYDLYEVTLQPRPK